MKIPRLPHEPEAPKRRETFSPLPGAHEPSRGERSGLDKEQQAVQPQEPFRLRSVPDLPRQWADAEAASSDESDSEHAAGAAEQHPAEPKETAASPEAEGSEPSADSAPAASRILRRIRKRPAPGEESEHAEQELPSNVVSLATRQRLREEERQNRRIQKRLRLARRLKRRVSLRRRAVLFSAVVVLCSLAAVALAVFSPWMRVETVTISGNSFVSSELIHKQVDAAKGQALPKVDRAELERKVSELPGVDHVSIVARPPHEIQVRVAERPPVAQVPQGDKVALIDSEGNTMQKVPADQKIALPVISAETVKKESVFRALTTALSNIPAEVLKHMTSAKAESADSIELTMDSGITVAWGNQEKAAQKAAVLQAMLSSVAAWNADEKNTPLNVQTIDVSVPSNPVTR